MKNKEPMVTIELSEYEHLNKLANNKHVVHKQSISFGYSFDITKVYTEEGLLDLYVKKIEALEEKLDIERNKSLFKRIFG